MREVSHSNGTGVNSAQMQLGRWDFIEVCMFVCVYSRGYGRDRYTHSVARCRGCSRRALYFELLIFLAI